MVRKKGGAGKRAPISTLSPGIFSARSAVLVILRTNV
jgi:hypothetical protein